MTRTFTRASLLSLVLLLSAAPQFAQGDPGATGPRAVSTLDYTLGDTAFTPTGFPGPVEITGRAYYPAALTGPYPFVLLLHGRHATCYMGTSAGGTGFLEWPCTPPRQPIKSYLGYEYVATALASNGYFVVSIGSNGINAKDNQVFDLGAQARAELIQRHLDLWNTTNTSGSPFGSQFGGKVDLSNVGTMGHSRGGEGVVRHYLYNQSLGSPYGIRAVFPLAPVDFNRPVINNVPLAVLLPYCDGDVADLQGVHYYDDARYRVAGDPAAKHTILVMGANHNFYNLMWTPEYFAPGAADDWLTFVSGGSGDPHCGRVPGNARLSPAQQRGTGLAYMSAFFRTYLGGESFASYLTGDSAAPPSATTNDLFVSFQAPDTSADRKDVNRLLSSSDLTTNTLGGAVTQLGITPYDLCGGEAPQPRHCLPGERTSRQPHTTVSARAQNVRGLSQLRGGWIDATAFIENDLPVGAGDVSGYTALQFRASVNFADVRNAAGLPQDLTVTVTDRDGYSVTRRVSDLSRSLFYPPGELVHVPKVFLNTVRLPLSAFGGINLTEVASVRFDFNQTTSGALLISDIAFAR